MATVEHWQTYWKDKSKAGFRFEDEDHYQRCAAELKVLFHHTQPKSVLEIGCGNGALYKYLEFDKCDYRGIDFSESMLNVFHAENPDAYLICADGSTYLDDNQYDLIFSNGVLQHFDHGMLRDHFKNSSLMMKPTSLFVSASIPWRKLWFHYLTGELTGNEKPNTLKGLFNRLRCTLKQDNMGYWHNINDFKRLAAEAGLSAAFYGSIFYPYRFHTVMTLLG